MPKISVIVPVYKVEKYLNRCVDSILAQTLSDFELILVDDGSPDNCGIICDDYQSKDNRVVVIHKENGGLSDARNKGIERALTNGESEWITFIDSDDYVNERYLELLFSAAINNQVDLSCCGLKKFNGDSAVGEFDGEYNVFIAEPDILIAENHPFERKNSFFARSVKVKALYFGDSETVFYPKNCFRHIDFDRICENIRKKQRQNQNCKMFFYHQRQPQ